MSRSSLLFVLCLWASGSALFAQNFVTTYAGDGVVGLLDGDTLTARFDQPSDIDRDPAGNLIVVDLTNMIRKISPAGAVTTLAGTGIAGYLDGPGASAKFNSALNACVDSVGNVYVSDFANQRIRKIDVNGLVTTIAGNGVAGYKDTTALAASFRYPRGICMDRQGNLYIADSWNHRIRKLDPAGNVTTFAGGGTSVGVQSIGGHVDGPDTSARFWTPCGLEIDAQGNLFLADAYNHRIRQISPQGLVSTLAGSGPGGSTSGSYLDGAAASARFNIPTGLGIDAQGDVYVADTYNNCLRYVSGGNVSTAAGSPTPGFVNGNSAQALFDHPRSTIVDPSGAHFYIPDGNNHVIRKMTLNLTIGTLDAMEQQLSIYPNPAYNTIAIKASWASASDPIAIKIYDPLGKLVIDSPSYAWMTTIPVTALGPGIYTAVLTSQGKTATLKFIKQL
jgi:Secretion system C-terminal sorting domain/NHL repeat